MNQEQIHFLTGRLAESALRQTLQPLSVEVGFEFTIQVMPISVAALMTPEWIAKHIQVPKGTDRVIVPGYCDGDLSPVMACASVPVDVGPRDLRQLPQYFGRHPAPPSLEAYDIEILAEINHVPRLSIAKTLEIARSYAQSGADMIDIGCIPGETCRTIGDYVKALVDEGLRVSIDSLNVDEIEMATAAGAELVLSVNSSNREAAADWGCEVVAIPDQISEIESLDATIEFLANRNIPLRIDPILEPIGLGFTASLSRYIQARTRWPDAEIMMGIGNLTELTDVDAAGVNFLLLGICEELGVRSVLTTQVINWARTSIAECSIARRLVHFAVRHGVPPKNLSEELVVLRDSRPLEFTAEQIAELAGKIRDHNYRILNSNGLLHLLGSGKKFSGADPFELFDALEATEPKNLDASHAFYLGYEMCKALTAITLGKNYVQDEALDWGHLTVPETNRHRLRKIGDRSSS